MVDGRLREQWSQCSWLSAAMFNAQPGRKTPVKPHRINPYRGLLATERREVVTDLHDVFGIPRARRQPRIRPR